MFTRLDIQVALAATLAAVLAFVGLSLLGHIAAAAWASSLSATVGLWAIPIYVAMAWLPPSLTIGFLVVSMVPTRPVFTASLSALVCLAILAIYSHQTLGVSGVGNLSWLAATIGVPVATVPLSAYLSVKLRSQ